MIGAAVAWATGAGAGKVVLAVVTGIVVRKGLKVYDRIWHGR